MAKLHSEITEAWVAAELAPARQECIPGTDSIKGGVAILAAMFGREQPIAFTIFFPAELTVQERVPYLFCGWFGGHGHSPFEDRKSDYVPNVTYAHLPRQHPYG